MKKLISFFCIVAICSSCTKTIYIVRHAEKETTVKNDPPLTAEGKERAATLATTLNGKKIQAVFSTNTIRTTTTAAPTAKNYNITTQLYKPDRDSVRQVLVNICTQKQNALVVGHSNTIIPILEVMGIQPTKTEVPDWEYDNLFVVKYKKYQIRHGNFSTPFVIKKVYYKKYGNTSKPVLAQPSMKQ